MVHATGTYKGEYKVFVNDVLFATFRGENAEQEARVCLDTLMRAREAELTSHYEREEGYHDDELALIEDDHFKTYGF
jgi:hypothetical protein